MQHNLWFCAKTEKGHSYIPIWKYLELIFDRNIYSASSCYNIIPESLSKICKYKESSHEKVGKDHTYRIYV